MENQSYWMKLLFLSLMNVPAIDGELEVVASVDSE